MQAFQLQNAYRHKRGVKALKWHRGVRLTAKAACYVIARKGRLEHDTAWFKGLQKIFRTGELGENIGWGQDDASEVVGMWIDSPMHERNMRDPDYTHGAIASVYSRKNRKRIWVAHFAEKG
jgi:uncharacterized protein YkwD